MLSANSEGVLVAREDMRQLRTDSSASKWAYSLVVGSSEGITLVIPVYRNKLQRSNLSRTKIIFFP